MKPYQEEYLALMAEASQQATHPVEGADADALIASIARTGEVNRKRIARGTQLLREELFPTLDDILAASPEEIDALREFADAISASPASADVGLNYRIRLALVSYARQRKLRDMLIRELYHLGMALYNLESSMSPNCIRVYSARLRMCFTEAASYFETEYDEITDPEIRGYIHRSMGNIALSYDTLERESARGKLESIARSIRVLSDADVQAKTPSLPWDLYLYKSHQERVSLLGYLRTGEAGPEVFAQVLESAQIVMQRQIHAAREQGIPLQPRWQYSFYAARYHCGAMLLPELLERLYALSNAMPEDDYSYQSLFSHVSIPALFMEYSKELKTDRERRELAPRINRMLKRMFPWLARVSVKRQDLSFALRQFLYAYIEVPGCMSFNEASLNVFAILRPENYVRMWMTGRLTRLFCEWTMQDCPEQLAALPGCKGVGDVERRRDELLDFAAQAGTLCDVGMVHFLNIESNSCRGLFEEEQTLLQLHAYCGSELLSQHESTARCADVAYGHHCHYDERGGYPLGFSPRSSPVKPIIRLVSAANLFADTLGEPGDSVERFERALDALREGAGTRYAPFTVELLRTPERRQLLLENMWNLAREACEDLFRRRRDMMAQ